MFDKILIANRGEIACRVIKTAKKLGIRTVAVYSDADRDSLHVNLADEAVYLGASPASESYLAVEKILQAAIKTGAQAVHPGYGFLSENAGFSRRCEENGLRFIGPKTDAIEKMGSKSAAKSIMERAQVPLIPGYHGENQKTDFLQMHAEKMGYPILLKAVAGGGGKGMRIVENSEAFLQSLGEAKREAKSSFANDDILLEKYLSRARHVEVQVFFDQHGNGVYLYDRDCSIQRRHQKIIEEAPAPGLSESLRKKMGEAAIRAAEAIDYVGAGTVEFLLDKDGEQFYFMEMNTRLQVEHPVTEMITGFDLVEWQIRVASGEVLPVKQCDIAIDGHAFEVRLYAEDPEDHFFPSTGKLVHLQFPEEDTHTRVDTGVKVCDEISAYYDPMIAKLIVWDKDRRAAGCRMQKALDSFQIVGVKTNIAMLHQILALPDFMDAKVHTDFIPENTAAIFHYAWREDENHRFLAALFIFLHRTHKSDYSQSPWSTNGAWRMNLPSSRQETMEFLGEHYRVCLVSDEDKPHEFILKVNEEDIAIRAELDKGKLIAEINGTRVSVEIICCSDTNFTMLTKVGNIDFSLVPSDVGDHEEHDNKNECRAPMNARVLEVYARPGEKIKKNAPLVVMEAMKMEHTVCAPVSGFVERVLCQANDLVGGGDELVVIARELA